MKGSNDDGFRPTSRKGSATGDVWKAAQGSERMPAILRDRPPRRQHDKGKGKRSK